MATFVDLPLDTLHDIISHLKSDLTDLLNCTLVCQKLWEPASVALYHSIDFEYDDGNIDTDGGRPVEDRQNALLGALAENHNLAAMVRTFKDKLETHMASSGEKLIHISAAKNMSGLTKAKFLPSHYSAHIIANLQSYPQLSHLTIIDMNPNDHIWRKVPQTNLRHLDWKIPERCQRFASSGPGLWTRTALLLINAVESTCPALESLDITAFTGYSCEDEYDTTDSATYDDASISTNSSGHHGSNLQHLRHFGYSYRYCEESSSGIQARYLAFVTKHLTLTSLTIPVPPEGWTRESLEWILQINDVLPNLKSLKLVSSMGGASETRINALGFFAALTNSTLSQKIENLSLDDLQASFSHEIGTLFGSWRNLKVLSVGDTDNSSKRNPTLDGRPQFDLYRPHILELIQALPPSVEEIYLQINGMGLFYDDDKDFDPICDLALLVFSPTANKPRLRSLDIDAWISNFDASVGYVPEKGVFYRRLPHQQREGNRQSAEKRESRRDIWISRMDRVYQEDRVDLNVVIEEVEGVWEGRDAHEAWCGGLQNHQVKCPTTRGRSQRDEEEEQRAWPVEEVNVVDKYWANRRKYPLWSD